MNLRTKCNDWDEYSITLDQSRCFGTELAYATAAPIPPPAAPGRIVQVSSVLPRKKSIIIKMEMIKIKILINICYTDLVYGRINKKLGLNHTNHEIERFIYKIINDAYIDNFKIIGKNYYIENYEENIRLTINRNTFRIITADRMKKR